MNICIRIVLSLLCAWRGLMAALTFISEQLNKCRRVFLCPRSADQENCPHLRIPLTWLSDRRILCPKRCFVSFQTCEDVLDIRSGTEKGTHRVLWDTVSSEGGRYNSIFYINVCLIIQYITQKCAPGDCASPFSPFGLLQLHTCFLESRGNESLHRNLGRL